MVVIGFSGYGEAGKDSSAKILKEKLEAQGKRVLILHYADLLKFYCEKYFGWDGKKDEAGRTLLQVIGTDKVRSKFPDFWVHSVASFILAFENDFDFFLIADCRFVNEFEYIKKCKFPVISVRVNRPNHQNALTPEQRLHPSETSLDNYSFDYRMDVDEGLDKLEQKIDEFIEVYKLI